MRLMMALSLLGIAGCADKPPPAAAPTLETRTSSAEVVRDGDSWTVDFRFGQASPAWLFTNGSVSREGRQPWRPGSWTVETPGVRIERRGRHDVLFAESGNVPERVRVRFRPVTVDLIAEYDPALLFTDGSVALWSAHFHLVPVASAQAATALPLDLNGTRFPGNGSQVTFRDTGGRVLHIGRRFDSATLIGGRAYVLFGTLEPVVSPDIATVIDPALPGWLKRELAQSTPAILKQLTEWLGPHGGSTPTLLVSWRGPTAGLESMGGSTLPTQIAITFEGIGVVAENERVRAGARTFIAHESAHYWLGNVVRYEMARDAWIMEGGSDLLAIRTIDAIDPAYDARPWLQSLLNECAALAVRPVASAGERGDNRAYYACGAVFGMVAEAASRQPFPAYVRRLIDANRAEGVLTRAEWLDALDAASGKPALRRDMELLLDQGAAEPGPVITRLLKESGIPHEIGPGGIPRLQ
jgi:hypothetical protein